MISSQLHGVRHAARGATLQKNPARFPRAIIVEGGWGSWTQPFGKSGGGGAAGRVVYAPGAGPPHGH